MSLPVPTTRLVQSLPATVPFVGPENQERTRGRPFRARIGANESSFGPSPKVIAAMNAAAPEQWKSRPQGGTCRASQGRLRERHRRRRH
jgi:histidinol-phosphate/aromatic aminotransferase/cobyric acid decarboxylase-like protein